jgi:hypothetical protein
MGEFALTVEHMAWVYGSLIERVLIGGFKDCRDASSTNGFESCLELIKPDNTSLPSSSVCSLLLTDVGAELIIAMTLVNFIVIRWTLATTAE